MSQLKDLVTGIVAVVAVLILGVGMTVAGIYGYRTGASSRDAELTKLAAQRDALSQAIKDSEAQAREQAALAQGKIDVLARHYLEAAGPREVETQETIRYVTRTVPRDRLCLDAGTVRVLDALRDPATADPDKLDPRAVAGTLGTAPAPRRGATGRPDFGGGVSAQAVAVWSAKVTGFYNECRERHAALAAIVRVLPGVTITDGDQTATPMTPADR